MYIPCKDISLNRLASVSLIKSIYSSGILNPDLQAILDASETYSKYRSQLADKISSIIKQFGLPVYVFREVHQLVEWMTYDFILYLDALLRNEFFMYKADIGKIVQNIVWDMHGSIDEVETFRKMKYANHHYNYMISALYCLEEDIPLQWLKCSPVYKPFTLKNLYSEFCSYAAFIIYYWTCRLKNRTCQLQAARDPVGLFHNIKDRSVNFKLLVVSIHICNVHSFKYFWRRLTARERSEVLSVICGIYNVDDLYVYPNDFYDMLKNVVNIILFLLGEVNEHEQLMIIRECLPQMIAHFWQYWQLHHVILPLFENYASVLDESSYKKLFERLLNPDEECCPKGMLVYKMWCASPPHLQRLLDDHQKKLMLSGLSSGS